MKNKDGFFIFLFGVAACFLVVLTVNEFREEPLPEEIVIERSGKVIGVADTTASQYLHTKNGLYLGFPIYGRSEDFKEVSKWS